jgi:CRP-like cAMP-binding protein
MLIKQNTTGTPTGNEATAALRGSPLFGQASDAEIAVLALSCRIDPIAAGRVILKEGDEADDVYLLLRGELLCFSHDGSG